MWNPTQIPDILKPFRDKKLRIGFSGGADSTALLLLLLRWGWRAEQLHAVHFEHGLRGAAGRADASWCEQFCAGHAVPFTRVDLKLGGNTPCANLEAVARRARFAWFAAHDDGTPVLLGHHADDADENLLLRLARGGNAGSLAGLREKRTLWSLTVLRPLLHCRKVELETFLRAAGVPAWRTDATNADEHFARNYLRNHLLPEWFQAFPPARRGLARAREALACDADFIEQCAARELAKLGDRPEPATPVAFWRALHPALAARVLRGYLVQLTGAAEAVPDRTQLAHWLRALRECSGEASDRRRIELSRAWRFEVRGATVYWCGGAAAVPEPDRAWDWRAEPDVTWNQWWLRAAVVPGAICNGTGWRFCFDAARMPAALRLAARRGAERMTVWNENHERRLKHLLTGAHPKTAPVLITDSAGVIFAVPGVRRSAWAPVQGSTAETLVITAAEIGSGNV